MTRLLWYVLRLGVVIAAAVWVAARPGTLSVDWQGYLISLPVWAAVLGVVGLAGAVHLLTRLLLAIGSGPRRWRERRLRRRRERGYKALTQGLVAVAAGDPRAAAKLAGRAEALLRDPPLTLLLSAQAAQLSGDEGAARRYFEAMLDRPDMAFLGLRGLLTQAMKAGDHAAALDHAGRAAALQPKADWPLKTLLSLQARQGRWADAGRSLDRLRGLKSLSPERVRHGQAALLLERSRQVAADGQTALALGLAQQAHDLAPDLAPAAAHLARLAAAQGDLRGARRALAQSWRAQPHPELAAAWADLGEGAALRPGDEGDVPLARVQRLEALVAMDEAAGRPPARAARFALAEACLDARLWGLARRQITPLLEDRPSLAAHRLRARLDAAEPGGATGAAAPLPSGPMAVAVEAQRLWALAATAPAEPAWTCGECGQAAPVWSAVCPACGGFDTLAWKSAGEGAGRAAQVSPARWRRLLPGRWR